MSEAKVWTPEERMTAADRVIELTGRTEMRPSTRSLIVQSWADGEIVTCVTNQTAIDLQCEVNAARQLFTDADSVKHAFGKTNEWQARKKEWLERNEATQ